MRARALAAARAGKAIFAQTDLLVKFLELTPSQRS